MYLFYSSDASELYKKDILSCISFPIGYTVHFRYPSKLIPEDLNLSKLKGSHGLIVYVINNDQELEEDKRDLKYVPIRKILIIDASYNENTDLYHFHLKVDEFVQHSSSISNKRLEKYVYKTDTSFKELKSVNWHEKVEEVVILDPSLKDYLFYNICISHAKANIPSSIEPEYDMLLDSSFFRLTENSSYLLELAFFNSSKGHNNYEKLSLKINSSSQDLLTLNSNTFSIGAHRDNRKISINTSKPADLILLFQSLNGDKLLYETALRIRVVRSYSRILSYFLITIITAIGTALIAYSVDFVKDHKNESLGYWVGFVGLLLFAGPSIIKYVLFNKQE